MRDRRLNPWKTKPIFAFLMSASWFLLSSFKPSSELFTLPLSILPHDWSVAGYVTAWTRFDFKRYFLNTAEQHLPSSTTGLLIATVPLAGVLVGVLLGRRAHLSWGNWVGIALGMAGVAAIVGLDVGGTDLPSVARLAVVAFGYALGPAIIARWMPTAPGIGVAAVSLAVAALVYAPVVGLTRSWPTAWRGSTPRSCRGRDPTWR